MSLSGKVPAALCCELWMKGIPDVLPTTAAAASGSASVAAGPDVNTDRQAAYDDFNKSCLTELALDTELADRSTGDDLDSASLLDSRVKGDVDAAYTVVGTASPQDAGAGSKSAKPLDVMVAHTTLLVLPGRWQDAATELQQHLSDMHTELADGDGQEEGGVAQHASCCLLEDMGMWLTHHQHRTPSGRIQRVCNPLLENLYQQMGDHLLLYVVKEGLGAVGDMVVDTLQECPHCSWTLRGSTSDSVRSLRCNSGPVPRPPAWWLRAACCLSSTGAGTSVVYSQRPKAATAPGLTSILHEAMLSRSQDMLRRVLR